MLVNLTVTVEQLQQLVSLLDLELRRGGLNALGTVVGLHNVLVPALAAAQNEQVTPPQEASEESETEESTE